MSQYGRVNNNNSSSSKLMIKMIKTDLLQWCSRNICPAAGWVASHRLWQTTAESGKKKAFYSPTSRHVLTSRKLTMLSDVRRQRSERPNWERPSLLSLPVSSLITAVSSLWLHIIINLTRSNLVTDTHFILLLKRCGYWYRWWGGWALVTCPHLCVDHETFGKQRQKNPMLYE